MNKNSNNEYCYYWLGIYYIVDCLTNLFTNRREEIQKNLTEPGETVQSIVAFPR